MIVHDERPKREPIRISDHPEWLDRLVAGASKDVVDACLRALVRAVEDLKHDGDQDRLADELEALYCTLYVVNSPGHEEAMSTPIDPDEPTYTAEEVIAWLRALRDKQS